MKKKQLPKKLHDQIKKLSQEGDEHSTAGEYEAALEKYREAWNLVPEDRIEWEASTWLLVSAGDVYLRQRNLDKALNSFQRAIQGPNGLGNPYIHFRLGQIQYELGDMERAGDELTRAYMGAGDEIFNNEDPKYKTFVHSILRPPAPE